MNPNTSLPPHRLHHSPTARHYRITLHPDNTLTLTIPRHGNEQTALDFLRSKLPWLTRAQNRRQLHPPPAKHWHLGTPILFRGLLTPIELHDPKTLRLNTHLIPLPKHLQQQLTTPTGTSTTQNKHPLPPKRASDVPQTSESATALRAAPPSHQSPTAPTPNPPSTPSDSDYSLVTSRYSLLVGDPAADLRPHIELHLRKLAQIELPARAWQLATQARLPLKKITIRSQRTRWGSCTRTGHISLNWRLIQLPDPVRDYIIHHELAHLLQLNHSKKFWHEVARLDPNYEQSELYLKQNPTLLH